MKACALFFTSFALLCETGMAQETLRCESLRPASQKQAREIATVREIAAYIPRASELRDDLRKFEARIQGVQQDILDLDQYRLQIRRVLTDFRRAYPNAPIPAEEEVLGLEAAMNPVFAFFAGNLRPQPEGCLRTIKQINSFFLKKPQGILPSAEDADLAVRLVEKLCRQKIR
jgi:hypothetical protein